MGCGPSSAKVTPVVEAHDTKEDVERQGSHRKTVQKFRNGQNIAPVASPPHSPDKAPNCVRNSELEELKQENAQLREQLREKEAIHEHEQQDSATDTLVIDLSQPREDLIALLNAELSKLEVYGPLASSRRGSTTSGGGNRLAPLPGPSGLDGQASDSASAQTIVIKRLEKDVAVLRDKLKRLKQSYERKMKRAKINTATQRADAETKIADLKEELNNVTRTHTELQEKYDTLLQNAESSAPGGGSQPGTEREKSADRSDSEEEDERDGSTALIVSLSQQIADQSEELEEGKMLLERYVAKFGELND
eukprot:m.187685 g.187685  ORF g.187685 m.187685 type:complete len:307 (-) comp18506_c0_seq14:1880-2800(-)